MSYSVVSTDAYNLEEKLNDLGANDEVVEILKKDSSPGYLIIVEDTT